MYTCDICGYDVSSPENLIRVWTQFDLTRDQAVLVCWDCIEESCNTVEIAEDDNSWEYLETRAR